MIDFTNLVKALKAEPNRPDDLVIIKDILDKFQEVKVDAEVWHKYVTDNRKLALLASKDDDSPYAVTISEPHNTVQFAKSVLLTAEFMPTATAQEETATSRESQSRYERFSLALWDDNDERQALPLRDGFITNTVVDGSAWGNVYIDPEKAPPDAILTEWEGNPVAIELVDTLQVYPKLSNNHKRLCDFILTYHQESLYDLRLQWPDKDWDQYAPSLDDFGNPVNERAFMIDVYNYHGYDDESNVVQTICTDKLLLDDEVLWASTEIPSLPWIISDCYSQPAPIDNATPGLALICRFQSMLHALEDDVGTAESLLSADMRAIDLYGNMPPVVITKSGREVEIDADWGNVVRLQEGEELGFPRWPGNPPDSSRMLSFVMGDMQRATFSAAATGFGGASASGYNIALTSEASRARLYLPARSIARAISKAGRMAAEMLRLYFPETMFHLYGQQKGQIVPLGFHPQMTTGLHLSCKVKLSMPGDDVRKAAIATQLKALGLPLATILEDVLDYQQPDQILKLIDEEQVRSHPIMVLSRMMQALIASNDPLAPLAAQALEKMLQQTVAGSNAPNTQGTPQQFRPPGQQSPLGMMGQEAAPLPEQGFGEVTGQVPQNQPAF